jgi:transcriptional regulator with XRE-family HTH domain
MRFADWINATNTTNAEFARRAGWTSETVRRYRNGEREPGTAEMATIFNLTDGLVTPNDWAGVGHRPGVEADAEPSSTEQVSS